MYTDIPIPPLCSCLLPSLPEDAKPFINMNATRPDLVDQEDIHDFQPTNRYLYAVVLLGRVIFNFLWRAQCLHLTISGLGTDCLSSLQCHIFVPR